MFEIAQKKEERKVFVRGIPPESTLENFETFFSQYGNIDECQLRIHPQSKLCMGQGTVTFQCKETAQSLFDRKINFEGHSLQCGQFFSGESLKKKIKLENRLKMLIFGLPPDYTSQQLARGMEFYKGITDARVALEHPLSTRNKGYGILTFRSESYKKLFLEISDSFKLSIEGRKLFLSGNLSDPRRNSQKPREFKIDANSSQPGKELKIDQVLTPKTAVNDSPKVNVKRYSKNFEKPSGPIEDLLSGEEFERMSKSICTDPRKFSNRTLTTKNKILKVSRNLSSSLDNYRLNGLSTSSEVFLAKPNKSSAVSRV